VARPNRPKEIGSRLWWVWLFFAPQFGFIDMVYGRGLLMSIMSDQLELLKAEGSIEDQRLNPTRANKFTQVSLCCC